MDDETDECIQKCPAQSKKAAKNSRKMSCAELLGKIKELTDGEKRGTEGGTKGLLQRFRDYRGDDDTHGPEIQKQQRSLRTYIKAYKDKGCGDPPDDAEEVAERALPEKVGDNDSSTVKTGAVVAGSVGLGYAAYRVIRFLPSLAPPLWWSIPENLVIP